MSDSEILKVFYEHIVKEAQLGRINCYSYFNLAFSTNIEDRELYNCEVKDKYAGIIVPTLYIKNKKEFDSLLIQYVRCANEFYKDDDMLLTIDKLNEDEKESMISREKFIICSLFANLTTDDFTDINSFLRNRINMFDNRVINSEEFINLGYVPSLDGQLMVRERKDRIFNETPYVIESYIHSVSYDSDYELPNLRVGLYDDKALIYAIQMGSKNNYQCSDEYYDLVKNTIKRTNVTTSFFIVGLMACGLFKDREIMMTPFLIERWNAKRIAIYVRMEHMKSDNQELFNELVSKQHDIQMNLTDKFIRLFDRLEKLVDGIEIIALPYSVSDKLHMKIKPKVHGSREVFNEIFGLCSVNEKEKEELSL